MARRKRKNRSNIDLVFIILIILSVVAGIIIYLKSGYIGEVISPIIGGAIGLVKYILPPGIFLLAIVATIDEKKAYTTRITQFIIIIIALCAMLIIFEISKENFKTNEHLSEIIKNAYNMGKVKTGGGVVGAIIAVPFVKLFGITGAGIILAVIVIILSFTAFVGSPTIFVREKIEDMKDSREDRLKEKEKRYKEREKEREKRRKQREKEDALEGQLRINLGDDSRNSEKEDSTSLMERLFGKKQDMGVDNDSHHIEDIPVVVPSPHKVELPENKDPLEVEISQEENSSPFIVTMEDLQYLPPSLSFLKPGKPVSITDSKKMITSTANKIQKTLYTFGVSAKVDDVSIGPAVTRYELIPAEGVRVNKIANLADDIALNLAAESIRIEAPIPGKRAVGIEVPNELREMVSFKDVLESKEAENEKSKIAFTLGKATSGEYVMVDIAKMPHILIAGSTGSGKSVCINTIINSIIYRTKPSDVKLVLIDPKVVELSVYNDIPHLSNSTVITDPQEALGNLNKVIAEMTQRFKLFAENNSKNIESFNQKNKEKIPYIVVIIDELADLMMTAAKEVESKICRIAQMGRAAGIHLVVATQRPSVDVITGLIKANMPTRIAFAVTSQVDSRTILDQGGAEKLLGRGDMLYYPIGATRPVRVQGAFISEKEINNIVKSIRRSEVPEHIIKYDEKIKEEIAEVKKAKEGKNKSTNTEDSFEDIEVPDEPEEIVNDIIDLFVAENRASISLIRRRYRMGDSRAGRIIDQIERMGYISSQQGNQARKVLLSPEAWAKIKEEKQKQQTEGEEE